MPFSTLATLIAPIGVFMMAVVTQTPAAPPDLTGLAAIITAGIGVFAFLISIWRGRQNNQRVQEIEDAASYVKGFDSLTKRLKEEIDELRQEQNTERLQWTKEKLHFEDIVGQLRVELNQQIAANYTLRGELAELRGQIKGFLNAQEYEEFQKHFQ